MASNRNRLWGVSSVANDTSLTIVGNLTDDPEIRFTEAGVAMARFTVASTPRIRDKDSHEYRDGEALFLTCTAWRETAEHAAESLRRGTRVIVVGRLRLSRWETEEGEKRSAYGLEVDEIGPSLRWATAKVARMARSKPGTATPPADDPWLTATADRPETTDASAEPSVPALPAAA
jgi:single-strand DNA-binding protein